MKQQRKFYQSLIAVFFLGLSLSVWASEKEALSQSPQFKDLSIIVSSTDKYAELWDPFFQLLFKQWSSLKSTNVEVPIYLISNKKAYLQERVTNIQIPTEKSWSDNMLQVLENVKTDYVVILLEDFFINHFDEKRLANIVDMARAHGVVYVQLTDLGPEYTTGGQYEYLEGLHRKAKHDDFRTSLSACLWRTENLKFLLKSGENPWEFESAPGNARSQGMMGEFLQVVENPPIAYLNMAFRGYLVKENVVRAEKELDIVFPAGKLPLDDDHKFALWCKTGLPQMLYWKAVVPCKQFFIKLFS